MNVLNLMDRSDLKNNTYRGSRAFLDDEKVPVESEAADHLIKLAQEYATENPLYVVAIGVFTNVASALMKCPEISERIVLIWLGGHAYHFHDTNEFNMKQDVAAVAWL